MKLKFNLIICKPEGFIDCRYCNKFKILKSDMCTCIAIKEQPEYPISDVTCFGNYCPSFEYKLKMYTLLDT